VLWIVLIFVILIVLLQIDDEPEQALTEIIDSTEIKGSSDAYLYLLAIDSAQNIKPLARGRQILARQQKASVLNNSPSSEDAQLVLAKNDLFCAYSQDSCLAYIFNNIDKIPSALQGTEIIINRYKKYLSYSDFKTLSEPHLTEVIPPYQFMIRAARLINLKQLLALSDNEQGDIKSLYEHHEALRKQLSLQDTLIGKMVILSFLSENIDFLSLLSVKFNTVLLKPLQGLTKQERSLKSGFNREIKMLSNMLENLDGSPDIFKQQGVEEVSVPSWVTHILFKKNITLNESYKILDYYAMLSEMTVAKFEIQMMNSQLQPITNEHWIRNPIGTVLNQIATPDYSSYISHFWDMDNKIQLFNAGINQTLGSTKVKSIYQLTEKTSAYFRDERNRRCFDSPYQQEPKYNCLVVGINRK